MSNKHTLEELKELQSLPLYLKISLTRQRIREWVNRFGEDGVYVAFSGGKDSTVLLDIVRKDYPDIPACFIDTGLEYPEIREQVRKFDNVTWVKPEKNFKQVVDTYGYPIISKRISRRMKTVQRWLTKKCAEDSEFKRRYENREISLEEFSEMFSMHADVPVNCKILFGNFEHRNSGEPSTMISHKRHRYLVNAPFKISDNCCDVMKKRTAHKYVKETGRVPILGTMAEESEIRRQKWLADGCNAFDTHEPHSTPMSFWTDQDVLHYLYSNEDVPLASIYGDIVKGPDGKFRTTGRDRTGCMFCLFGCHLERESRFEQMRETHPKIYEWLMKPESEGGLGYKEVIDWLNTNGQLNIRY